MTSKYDADDKSSVVNYAKRLIGQTLDSACPGVRISESIPYEYDKSYNTKGAFGQFLEKHYFEYKINSESRPDFIFKLPGDNSESLELKSSPIKKNKNGALVSKERLVLSIIDFEKLPSQNFESSDFWTKNNSLLLVFYLYELEKLFVDYKILLVDEWHFDSYDLQVIQGDWEYIKSKVSKGLAHKISEGDTYYLGACTKGTTSKNKRLQFSSSSSSSSISAPAAKQRAFSLKQGYVNHVIANIAGKKYGNKEHKYGRILNSVDDLNKKKLEDVVVKYFQPHLNKTVVALASEFNFKINISNKNSISRLVNSILKIGIGKKIVEFEKADISVRAVELNSDGMPKQNMSFPAFDYCELIDEAWDDSSFKYEIDRKFLFIFFKEFNGEVLLEKVKFWNMPYDDINSCKAVWENTRNLVSEGRIIKSIDFSGVKPKRRTNFPFVKNDIAHVRPHGRDAEDCYPLPVPDVATGATSYTKHSFWLNKEYVRESIFNQI